MTSPATAFSTRRRKANNGVAAYGTTSTLSTWKFRSGIRLLDFRRNAGFGPQLAEEFLDLLPDFRAAAKALPVRANQTNELVAFIDGHDRVDGGPGSAWMADAIHQQRFDVRLHLIQRRIFPRNFIPAFERQKRFGSARGARIKRGDSAFRRAMVEKRHVDRNPHGFPLRIRHLEVGKPADAARNAFIFQSCLMAEKNRASFAGANKFSLNRLDQVLMFVRQRDGAKLAALDIGTLAHKLPQRGEGPILFGRAQTIHSAPSAGAIAARGTATRARPFSASSGSGSKCRSGAIRERPARTTSNWRSQEGQTSVARSSNAPSSDFPQAAQLFS